MCGIAGYILDKSDNQTQKIFDESTQRLEWRGPDHQDSFVWDYHSRLRCKLYHSRLSIIDLTKNGNQPFFDINKDVVCSYNGEIYNYREVREELVTLGHEFYTESDTEVLVTAWKQWREKAFSKFTGMFAVALLDLNNKRLYLARDFFGIKPLYYAKKSNGLIFSSDPVCVANVIGLRENRSKVIEYIEYGTYDNSEETFFADVKSLETGSYLVFDLTTSNLVGPLPWTNDKNEISDGFEGLVPVESAVKQIKQAIEDSVNLHLRADVDIAIALSGGIDSSIIAGVVRKLRPKSVIHTFSYIAPGALSEERFVDLVNESIGAIPTKIATNDLYFSDDLDDLIAAQGEPFASLSIYAQYLVFREIKKSGIKVSLDGQGADELFSGYHSYASSFLGELLTSGRLREFWQFIDLRSSAYGVSRASLFVQAIKDMFASKMHFRLNRRFSSVFANENRQQILNVVRQRQKTRSHVGSHRSALYFSLFKQGLPALLRHGDRNSMYHSVESRVPFLTQKVFLTMRRLPSNLFFGANGVSKSLLRYAFHGLVPTEVLTRIQKIGFEAPDRKILLQQKELLLDLVSFAREESLLDQNAVATLITDVEKNDGDSGLLWRLVNYMKWKNLFLPKSR